MKRTKINLILFVLLAIVFIITFATSVLAQTPTYGCMFGWNFSGGWIFGVVTWLLVVITLILFIFWLIKQITKNEKKKD